MKRLISAFVLMYAIVPAFAQTQYSGTALTPKKAIYLLASAGRPNYGREAIYGATVGGYVQWGPVVGVDARFMDLPFGATGVHQFFIGAGPRVRVTKGRFQIFGSVDGGVGHAQYTEDIEANSLYHASGAGSSFSYFLTGGADYVLTRRLSIRLGEFNYGSIQVLNDGLNPKIFSSGIVLKVF